ncbi:MAG TPA: alpha/beta hydrolase [Ferrovibrio sp.]|uniref:alpha/beta hydrolase n=1 Tax=Ferrovibrio sp. TaxID=1917215 RepID=UPI002ED2882D
MLACVGLGACAATDRLALAERQAAPAGLQFQIVETPAYRLAVWRRLRDPSLPVDVYIEGDGLAWLDRTHPSPDPTPRHPVGLLLAVADPAPNVIYLARPCMYVDLRRETHCQTGTWTDGRFDQSAVEAIDRALGQMKPAAMPANLVGYSGGAAIAVALAARRRDILSLRTVAGNLDPAAVNRLHHVSRMPTAIDVAALAPRLKLLPQRHFVGNDDKIVPASIAERFSSEVGACAAVGRVAASHGEGWHEQWPRLLQMPLPCR